jgi:hypothetical protein
MIYGAKVATATISIIISDYFAKTAKAVIIKKKVK